MTDTAGEVVAGDPFAVPARRKPSDGTHLVNGVRAEVDAWRANGYPGASHTTRRLFGFWFEDEHRTGDGYPFRFYFCQREAVETFVYLTEIKLFAGGEIVGRSTTAFEITKAGFEEFVAEAARDHGLLYGLVTALLALLTGWFASVVLRRD